MNRDKTMFMNLNKVNEHVTFKINLKYTHGDGILKKAKTMISYQH